MDKKKVIDVLNKALAEELSALIQYMEHHYLYEGSNSVCVRDFFKKLSMNEMDHAYKLGERIAVLGGLPTVKPNEIKIPKKPLDMIKVNLESELAAIDSYRKWIKEVEAADDPVSRLMLEEILGDEEDHAHDLDMLLK